MKPLARRLGALAILLAVPYGGALAGTQLFKCMDGGRTVYQQQACSVSSQPDVAASAPHAAVKTSAPIAETVTAATRKVRSPTSPASAALATPR